MVMNTLSLNPGDLGVPKGACSVGVDGSRSYARAGSLSSSCRAFAESNGSSEDVCSSNVVSAPDAGALARSVSWSVGLVLRSDT